MSAELDNRLRCGCELAALLLDRGVSVLPSPDDYADRYGPEEVQAACENIARAIDDVREAFHLTVLPRPGGGLVVLDAGRWN